ncbi:MAG TPA: helix-turn-helix domain-containing protein [Micromonosporaceae bacterium]|nr:helix-turn-helix domain-containing protein [Micromonosporaceae bacterium]
MIPPRTRRGDAALLKLAGTENDLGVPVGGCDPLQIDASFWQRDDVVHALSGRDIGTLFRLVRRYAGASQHRIGTAVGIQQGTISAIMRGDRAITSIDVLERIADGLGVPGQARTRLGLAPKEEPMHRRTALGIGLVAAISPATITEALRESAAEALEFTRGSSASAVGAGTLDHFAAVVRNLDRAYHSTPPHELFAIARAYRQRVAQLIDGPRTLHEARELFVYAARLSYLLSDLSGDLNSWLTAKAWAIDSQHHAHQAEHQELCAWAADAHCTASGYVDGPADTVKVALNGLRQISDDHPLAVRLRAQAADGHARQGNRPACAELLAQARTLCDRLPDQAPSSVSPQTATAEYTTYTLTSRAATSYVRLTDWTQAAHHARATLGVATHSPGRADQARLDLAIALAHLGNPDEAIEHATPALASARWLGGTLPRARELDAVLTTRYPELPSSQEFHDQYQLLASQATPN